LIKTSILKWSLMKQVVPTESDIEAVRNLAKRLKGATDTETLNNILEWQERNIIYWRERGYLDILIGPVTYSGFIIILILASIPLIMLFYLLLLLIGLPLYASIILSLTCTLLILIALLMRTSTIGKLLYIVILSYPISYIVQELLTKYSLNENIITSLNIIININLIIFGISFFTIMYLFIIYKPFTYQERGFKNKLNRILELMELTFTASLPLAKMLEYRMGICRDYAKLTVALLLHLYPESEVFFFTLLGFFGHVATGLRINDKIYILDQNLPILEPEAWLTLWRKEKTKVFKLIKKEGNRLEIRYVNEISNKSKQFKTFNLRAIFKDVVNEVIKAIDEKRDSADITLRNVALLLNIDDEVIRESLLRKIRIVFQNELINKETKVKDIQILKNDTDIILRMQLVNTA